MALRAEMPDALLPVRAKAAAGATAGEANIWADMMLLGGGCVGALGVRVMTAATSDAWHRLVRDPDVKSPNAICGSSVSRELKEKFREN